MLPDLLVTDSNSVILNSMPRMFLHFWIPFKIASFMMYHLSMFNCLFGSYKELKIDILAPMTAISAKLVTDRAKQILHSYLSFLSSI